MDYLNNKVEDFVSSELCKKLHAVLRDELMEEEEEALLGCFNNNNNNNNNNNCTSKGADPLPLVLTSLINTHSPSLIVSKIRSFPWLINSEISLKYFVDLLQIYWIELDSASQLGAINILSSNSQFCMISSILTPSNLRFLLQILPALFPQFDVDKSHRSIHFLNSAVPTTTTTTISEPLRCIPLVDKTTTSNNTNTPYEAWLVPLGPCLISPAQALTPNPLLTSSSATTFSTDTPVFLPTVTTPTPNLTPNPTPNPTPNMVCNDTEPDSDSDSDSNSNSDYMLLFRVKESRECYQYNIDKITAPLIQMCEEDTKIRGMLSRVKKAFFWSENKSIILNDLPTHLLSKLDTLQWLDCSGYIIDTLKLTPFIVSCFPSSIAHFTLPDYKKSYRSRTLNLLPASISSINAWCLFRYLCFYEGSTCKNFTKHIGTHEDVHYILPRLQRTDLYSIVSYSSTDEIARGYHLFLRNCPHLVATTPMSYKHPTNDELPALLSEFASLQSLIFNTSTFPRLLRDPDVAFSNLKTMEVSIGSQLPPDAFDLLHSLERLYITSPEISQDHVLPSVARLQNLAYFIFDTDYSRTFDPSSFPLCWGFRMERLSLINLAHERLPEDFFIPIAVKMRRTESTKLYAPWIHTPFGGEDELVPSLKEITKKFIKQTKIDYSYPLIPMDLVEYMEERWRWRCQCPTCLNDSIDGNGHELLLEDAQDRVIALASDIDEDEDEDDDGEQVAILPTGDPAAVVLNIFSLRRDHVEEWLNDSLQNFQALQQRFPEYTVISNGKQRFTF